MRTRPSAKPAAGGSRSPRPSRPEPPLPQKRVIVQKFGGTSVADVEARRQALGQIRRRLGEGYAVAVVVSAMGRSPDPYATDTLIQLTASLGGMANPAIQDLLLSCGEVIAACVMGQQLEIAGIPATVLPWHTLGIVTDASFGDALPRLADVTRLREEIRAGKVVVLPGFQGTTPDGEVTTLGRGGSDLTAVVIGAALGAEMVEIFTDVDGVKVADPRLYPGAPTLSEVTYEELGELAYHGAKVIHAKAVAMATQERVPLTIRSTFSAEPGTRVVRTLANPEKVVTGIAHAAPVAFARVPLLPDRSQGELRDLLERFARARISLDMIHLAREHAYFIFKEEHLAAGREILLSFGGGHALEAGYAKVSVVGAGMWGIPGVMVQVVEALEQAGIPLYHSTDSYITISCLVPQGDLPRAVEALVAQFDLLPPEGGDQPEPAGG